MTGESAIVQFDQLRLALERANSIGEVKTVHDLAEAARHYAQVSKLGLDAENYAAEIRLRAERRLGEFLAEMDLRSRRQENINRNLRSPTPMTSEKTLSELGYTKNQSSRWQKIASIPVEKFETYIATIKKEGEELTTAGTLRLIPKPPNGGKTHSAVADAAEQVKHEVIATGGHVSVAGASIEGAITEAAAEAIRPDNELLVRKLEQEDGVEGWKKYKGECPVDFVDRGGRVTLFAPELVPKVRRGMRIKYILYVDPDQDYLFSSKDDAP